MSDIDEIKNLIGRYSQLVDDRRYADLADITTADVEFDIHGTVVRTAEAFAARLAANESTSRTGKHVTTNVVVEVDGDAATGSTDFTYIGRDGPDAPLVPLTLGRYTDRFVLVGRQWLLAARTIQRV